MQILHVYRTFFPDTQGGLEEVIRQICQTTLEQGAEAKVLALSQYPKPKVVNYDGIEVHRIKQTFEVASCGVSLAGFRTFRRLAEQADVVHYHFPWPFADMLHFAALRPRPAVMTYHSDIVRQRALRMLYQPLMYRFLRDMDVIACTSPNYFATSEILANCQNVEVVPIGISESSYPKVEGSLLDGVEQRYGRDFFLFVGVLRYYKGLHILLDAIKGASFKVVIVGSGPIERELKSQAVELELDNVTFAGQLDNPTKMALFSLCRGVVFPSYLRSEAFGVTLLEGAMCGKPLISTEVGSGTSHVNVDGTTGLVVPPGSSNALRQALDQLWSYPDAAQRMGRHARARYEELFTGELMGRRYMELYERIVGNTAHNNSEVGASTD